MLRLELLQEEQRYEDGVAEYGEEVWAGREKQELLDTFKEIV